MSTRKIVLMLIPISTLVMLLIMIQYEEAIFDTFPDPFGKVGMILIAAILLVTDGWVVFLLTRRFQREQEEGVRQRTGRRVEAWIDLLSRQGPTEREVAITWLRMEHGLTEEDATFILAEKERRGGPQTSTTDASRRWVVAGCVIGIVLAILTISGVMMTMFLRGR